MADKTQKFKILKNILENKHAEGVSIKRKTLINEACEAGLVEKDVYIILKKEYKSDIAPGAYQRDLMLDKVNKKLNVCDTKNVVKQGPRYDNGSFVTPVTDTDDYSNESSDWVLPYTEADIADELSLMGTTI